MHVGYPSLWVHSTSDILEHSKASVIKGVTDPLHTYLYAS